MRKVLLITGPGGDAQGWGDLHVTETVRDALCAAGYPAEIAWVVTEADFRRALAGHAFDIVWSALYYFSDRADIIGIGDDGDTTWVADLLDARNIPYIGPNAQTMKDLILKHETHRIMRAAGARVPSFAYVPRGAAAPEVRFPAFVKPDGESRSVGISDDSVVQDRDALERRVRYVHERLGQAALIEDFLPGPEYTVLMLGNGPLQEILPGLVTVDPARFGKHEILRSDLRGVGLTKIRIPPDEAQAREAREQTRIATDALRCWDHVRADLRADAEGRLRIMEVNGIPGLKPVKSWSPQIYSLYHPAPGGPAEEYRNMLSLIVRSALLRHGL